MVDARAETQVCRQPLTPSKCSTLWLRDPRAKGPGRRVQRAGQIQMAVFRRHQPRQRPALSPQVTRLPRTGLTNQRDLRGETRARQRNRERQATQHLQSMRQQQPRRLLQRGAWRRAKRTLHGGRRPRRCKRLCARPRQIRNCHALLSNLPRAEILWQWRGLLLLRRPTWHHHQPRRPPPHCLPPPIVRLQRCCVRNPDR